MEHALYNLTYDFIQQNGQYMVFTKKGQNPLNEDDLSALQVRMIESNRIPRILPMKIKDVDLEVSLQYNITSKRMLRLFAKESPLSMNDYFSLFISIIKTIEESNVYMLNDENYVLKEEFIFIGNDVHDVYLTYLPLENIEKDSNVLADLKELIINVASEVHGLHGEVFKQLLNYIKSSSFSLQGVKDVLRELQNSHGAITYNGMNTYNSNANKTSGNTAVETTTNPSLHPRDATSFQPTVSNSVPNQIKKSEATPSKKNRSKKNLAPLSQREIIYLFAAAALFMAIVWKVYEIVPNTIMLFMSSILSVLIISSSVGYWLYRKSEPKKRKKQKIEEEASMASVHQALEETATTSYQYGAGPQQPMRQNGPQQMNGRPHEEPSQAPYQHFHERMSARLQSNPPNDETILLGEDSDEEEEYSAYKETTFYLEVNRNGQSEQIVIDKDHFIIGRNDASVHYVENSPGLSRVHIEFVKINQSYGVKDLGSRNGTKLNERQIVPYKIYALEENAKLSIGSVTYTFKWSHK